MSIVSSHPPYELSLNLHLTPSQTMERSISVPSLPNTLASETKAATGTSDFVLPKDITRHISSFIDGNTLETIYALTPENSDVLQQSRIAISKKDIAKGVFSAKCDKLETLIKIVSTSLIRLAQPAPAISYAKEIEQIKQLSAHQITAFCEPTTDVGAAEKLVAKAITKILGLPECPYFIVRGNLKCLPKFSAKQQELINDKEILRVLATHEPKYHELPFLKFKQGT